MIDILLEQTLKAYNIDISAFHPTIHTKVIVQCLNCKEIFHREFGYIHYPHDCPGKKHKVDFVEVPRIEALVKDIDGIIPHRSRATDAGYDAHSLIDVTISPGQIIDINTGVKMVAPQGVYFTVEGRSSLYRAGVVPFRGIIDAGYVGDLVITLMNVGSIDYFIKKGDRIAQMVPHRMVLIDIMEVDGISPDYDIRGTAGFGSSGK